MSYGTVQAEKMTTESGYSLGAGNATSFKNRLINSEMDIDQRNGGASVSLTSGGGNGYPADRWYVENFTDGTATVQQVADAPTGFSNSIRYTVTATDTSLASDQSAFIQQRIEGFNFADMAFGTASAKTVTVSFWVKSSITGTFGVALANSAYSRGYPVSFTVNAANTWEQKTATITGDTTGTWVGSTNGVGVRVSFAVAAGSARVATSGAWSASVVLGASGQTNLMATNGATFQVTGVQLEVGTVATSFDFRPYGTELQLCQRYCRTVLSAETAGFGFCNGSANFYMFDYGTPLRATPSLSYSGTLNPTNYSSNISTITGVAAITTTTNAGGVRTAFSLNSSPSAQACGLNPNGNLVLITSEL